MRVLGFLGFLRVFGCLGSGGFQDSSVFGLWVFWALKVLGFWGLRTFAALTRTLGLWGFQGV